MPGLPTLPGTLTYGTYWSTRAQASAVASSALSFSQAQSALTLGLLLCPLVLQVSPSLSNPESAFLVLVTLKDDRQ